MLNFLEALSEEKKMKKKLVGTFLFIAYVSAMAGSTYYHSVVEYGYEKIKHTIAGDDEFTAVWPLPSVGDTLQVRSPLADAEMADLGDDFGKKCDIDDAKLEIERFSDGLIIVKVISREYEWRCPVGTHVMMSRFDWMELVDDTNDHHEDVRARTERLKRTRDLLEQAE